MNRRITDVRVRGPSLVELSITDGTVGTVDLAPWIQGRGSVFAPLNDPEFFARVTVDQDAGTIAWPNEVDLDPDLCARRHTA